MKKRYNGKYIFRLSGEEPDLAKRELESIVSGSCKAVDEFRKIIMTTEECEQPKRLSMTQEVAKIIHRGLREGIGDLTLDEGLKGSYAVRKDCVEPGIKLEKDMESKIGNILSNRNNHVDLDNPETIIKAYILEDEIILGRLEQEIDRGKFNQRKNQNRPFSSPVSLDPKLARTLVNLSGVKPGERLLDPFCGTGGILIEAGLCGVGVAGTDIDQEMVKGCRKNLEEYGIINHDIRQESAEKAPEAFDKEFDAIVTDLPYGRSSKKTKDIVEKFMNSIEAYDCRKIIMWNKDTLDGRNPDFSIDVHSSLTRYIYIID